MLLHVIVIFNDQIQGNANTDTNWTSLTQFLKVITLLLRTIFLMI